MLGRLRSVPELRRTDTHSSTAHRLAYIGPSTPTLVPMGW